MQIIHKFFTNFRKITNLRERGEPSTGASAELRCSERRCEGPHTGGRPAWVRRPAGMVAAAVEGSPPLGAGLGKRQLREQPGEAAAAPGLGPVEAAERGPVPGGRGERGGSRGRAGARLSGGSRVAVKGAPRRGAASGGGGRGASQI